jgi:hypothetical protein
MKVLVGNFDITGHAMAGKCVKKGHKAYRMNVGRSHFLVCDGCKTYIFIGENLSSDWRSENKRLWKRNAKKLEKYKLIDGED